MPTDIPDDLPEDVTIEAERLTRLARDAVDDEAAAYRERRAGLLSEHGYTARVRDADETPPAGTTSGRGSTTREGDVLVLHPAEWVEDGTIRVERIDDLERAVEIPLDGTTEEWASVETHNRELAQRVAREYGEVHGANAHAFADFMGNHHARPVEDATRAQVAEFLGEYYPRNAWPSDAQRATVEASLEHLFATAGVPDPPLPERPPE